MANSERIDVLLVERGLCESRARAQARIMAGDVIVDDKRIDKAGDKVSVLATIRLRGDDLPYVSRGALKLLGALDTFGLSPAGAVCMDVGASTGGFTEVLLLRGAQQVFAIDVGRAQLHEKLRQDARVHNMEKTHITKLAARSLVPVPTFATVDVSFISLKLVLPAMLAQLDDHATIVALVKPQFEVGKGAVSKGGIVKDATARTRALDEVIACATALGLNIIGQRESPITGTDGNVEYLLGLSRS